jgi:hypothetical protein
VTKKKVTREYKFQMQFIIEEKPVLLKNEKWRQDTLYVAYSPALLRKNLNLNLNLNLNIEGKRREDSSTTTAQLNNNMEDYIFIHRLLSYNNVSSWTTPSWTRKAIIHDVEVFVMLDGSKLLDPTMPGQFKSITIPNQYYPESLTYIDQATGFHMPLRKYLDTHEGVRLVLLGHDLSLTTPFPLCDRFYEFQSPHTNFKYTLDIPVLWKKRTWTVKIGIGFKPKRQKPSRITRLLTCKCFQSEPTYYKEEAADENIIITLKWPMLTVEKMDYFNSKGRRGMRDLEYIIGVILHQINDINRIRTADN